MVRDSYRKITKIQKQSTTSSKKLFNEDEASNEMSYKISSFATNTTNRHFINNLPTTPTNISSLNFSSSINNTKQQLLSTSNNQLPKIPFHNQTIEESFFSNKKGKMNYQFYQLIIVYSVYICALALLFIYIYSFFFKGTIFNNLENYLNINLILAKMKLYIISTCVSISSACLISDNIMKDNYYNVTLSIEILKGLVSLSSTKFFEQYKLLQNFLAKYSNYASVENILNVLYLKKNYTMINSDFSILKYESSLKTELNFFHYSSGMATVELFKNCNVRRYYLEHNTTGLEASEEDKLLYYVIYDVISNIIDNVDDMIARANTFIMSEYYSSKKKIVIFDIAAFAIGLMICFGFLFIIIAGKKKIAYLLKEFLK